jgi:hypothetical protein
LGLINLLRAEQRYYIQTAAVLAERGCKNGVTTTTIMLLLLLAHRPAALAV